MSSRSCDKLITVGLCVHMYIVRGRIEDSQIPHDRLPRGTESVDDHGVN
jgi:hypothetical protein